ERTGATVDYAGRPQRLKWFGPGVQSLRPLLHEHGLPPQIAQAIEVAVVSPVEELAASVRTFAGEQITLVVTVEVNAKILARSIVTLQQLLLDVRLASGGNERGRPILGGEDLVDLAARWHQARPADHRRHAIAAFPVGVLLTPEGGGTAVGPGERLGAVVGGIDHDGVVSDTEVVEFLKQFADLPVMLDHAVRINAEPSLA